MEQTFIIKRQLLQLLCMLTLIVLLGVGVSGSAWAEKTSAVSFVTYDGRIGTDVITEYTEGRVTRLPMDVTKEGYVFSGWYTNPSYFGEPVFVLPKDAQGEKIFYACWTSVAYTIAYDGNGSTSGDTPDTDMNYREANTLQENGFSRKGYLFSGWNTQADGKGIAFSAGQYVNCLTTESETITLYAQWIPEPPKLTIAFVPVPVATAAPTPLPVITPTPLPSPTPTPAPPHGPIIARDEVYPYGNLKQGEAFNLSGVYNAQGCNIASVCATVTDANGTPIWSYSQNGWNKPSFDVSTTVNYNFLFGTLNQGIYTYRLMVTDEMGSTKELSSMFSIVYVPLQGPCGVYRADGSYSADAYFTLFDDGELVIEGFGDVCAGKPAGVSLPWSGKKSEITRVTFLGEFTSLPAAAFAGCPKLETLSFPASLAALGERSAADCPSLHTVFFSGSAPSGSNVFPGVTADVSFPCNDPTWTVETRRAYGGELLWVPAHRYEGGICILCGDGGDKPAPTPSPTEAPSPEAEILPLPGLEALEDTSP